MKFMKKTKSVLIILLCLIMIVPALFSASAFEVRSSAPQSGNKYYYSSLNIYYAYGLVGECTWYAYGRAYEILGSKPNLSPYSASGWWDYNKSNGYYPYGSTPKVGAIVCYSGHVAVVEKIVDGTAILSEGNYSGQSFHYGRPVSSPIHQTLYGYIYILDGEGEKETTEKTTKETTTEATETTETTTEEAVVTTTRPTTTETTKPPVPVQSLTLNKSHLAVAIGSEITLSAAVLPVDAAPEITWESTNPLVAAVDSNGVVKTLANGKAVIMASVGNLTARCIIDVSDKNETLKSITLSENRLDIAVRSEKALTCALNPDGSVNVDLVWYSSNEKIATVSSDGVVTGKAKGYCKINCKDINSGIEASCPVTVKANSTTAVLGFTSLFSTLAQRFFSLFVNIFSRVA